MKLWKKYSCILLFTVAALIRGETLSAQKRSVHGKITNDLKEVLPSASVNLLDKSLTVISFTISNKNGRYTMILPDSLNMPLWLEVNYLGYKKQRQQLSGAIAEYNFILDADTTVLKDITVRNRPYIEQSGDTLRYLVNSFARAEDRSIGDVLRRLPGVDVTEDGTIYFNGKKIENLYIQGDDLMSGRYGLATKAIKKEMITGIDIIKNHQPIQVLKDKIFSDQTAINLILKDENSIKLSTEAIVGAGLPKQYDVTINPILLNKKIKMVNSVGFNNSGVDYKNDFKQLGNSNFISNIGNEAARIDLSAGTVGPPDLPLINYYFNRSGVIHLNSLYNTKNGLQLKTNIQGFTDRNTLEYKSLSENFLPNDTISYKEQQEYTDKPRILNMSFNVMSNKKTYFFNNNTQINLSNKSNLSHMDFDSTSFGQTLNKRLNEFSNDMNWTPSIKGKGVGEFRWLLSYTYDKQMLDIGSGYFSVMTDQPGYYDHTYQFLKLPTLFSNAYLSYRIPGNLINQEYKFGYIAERQKLESTLNFSDNGQTIPYTKDTGNDLNWQKDNVYFSPDYQFKYNQWKAALLLPITFQSIRYNQDAYNLNIHNKRMLFNPVVSLRYELSPEQYFTAAYKYTNSFANISNIFRGSILENYRTLAANDAELQERNMNTYSLNYDFQRSITLFFFNLGIAYDKISANTIFSTEVSDNIQKNILLAYRNQRENIIVSAGVSKYVFGLKSTFSIKSRLRRSDYQQLINNELYPFYGYEFSFSANVSKKLGAFQIAYQPSAYWYTSTINKKSTSVGNFSNTAFQLNQNLTFGVSAIKKYYFELNAKHSYVNQTGSVNNQYLFMDLKMQRNNIRKGTDLSFNVSNIFNVNSYTLYSVSANQLIANQYRIRGRMAIIRISFYF
jgi:hypothetical protein